MAKNKYGERKRHLTAEERKAFMLFNSIRPTNPCFDYDGSDYTREAVKAEAKSMFAWEGISANDRLEQFFHKLWFDLIETEEEASTVGRFVVSAKFSRETGLPYFVKYTLGKRFVIGVKINMEDGSVEFIEDEKRFNKEDNENFVEKTKLMLKHPEMLVA